MSGPAGPARRRPWGVTGLAITLKGLLLRSETPPAPAAGRDLRLDFFRGLALIFIFLNHIPHNAVSWISNRNFGFSDATEIFVFISGYSALLAYSGALQRSGFTVATARIWRRAWQVYTAHVFLFVVFVAHIAYLSASFDNPMFAEEMGVARFFDEPHIVLVQALLLKFRPVNMDVLPLYIVLLLAFPAVLWALRRWPNGILVLSFLLYAVVQVTRWNLPAYPRGHWFFNPLAWQFLFVLGAWCALNVRDGFWRRLQPALFAPLAALYLLFALAIVLTWVAPAYGALVPRWLAKLLYPIDKTGLDPLRLVHFLAQAYLVVLLVTPQSRFLSWPAARPVIRCGQQSLHVFCAGVFLSFAAHFVLTEFYRGLAAQFAVSAIGVGLMIALAYLMAWYRNADAPRARSAAAVPAVGSPGES